MMAAEKRDNIEIIENALLYSLKPITGGFCASVIIDGKANSTCAPFVVLATGGIGQVYKYTTNSDISTGDVQRLLTLIISSFILPHLRLKRAHVKNSSSVRRSEVRVHIFSTVTRNDLCIFTTSALSLLRVT